MSDAEKLSKIFEALAPLERWVPYTLTPSKSRPGKTDKIPGTKARRLSTSNPDHWFTLEDAGTAGDVGLVFTGGITQDGYTLLGFDVDNATKDFRFPIDTYIETSPSGHGLRAFAWCKSEWLEPYQDCTNAEAEDCEHVETYFGTAPRFLTVTFDFLGLSEIAVLTEKQFKEIAPWLKEKEKLHANQTPPKADGTPLDLSAYKLTDEHRRLLSGANGIDRSTVLHSLLCTLAPKASKDDLLATVLTSPPLWQYCLDHRHDDPDRALKFAQEEVNRATKKQNTSALEELGKVLKPRQQQQNQEEEPRRLSAPLIFTESELLLDPIARPVYTIDPFFPEGAVTIFGGRQGISKSTLCLDVAAKYCTQGQWAGYNMKHGKAAIFSREDDALTFKGRTQVWVRALDRAIRKEAAQSLINNLRVFTKKDTSSMRLTRRDFGNCIINQEVIDDICFAADGCGLIVIDCLAKWQGGSENDNEEVSHFMDAVEEIAVLTGAAVIVPHHLNKAAGKENSMSYFDLRGAGAISDARSIIMMAQLGMRELEDLGIAPSAEHLQEGGFSIADLADAASSPVVVIEHAKANGERFDGHLCFLRMAGPVLRWIPTIEGKNIGAAGAMLAHLEEISRLVDRVTFTTRELKQGDLKPRKIPQRAVEDALAALEQQGKVTSEFRGSVRYWTVRRSLV